MSIVNLDRFKSKRGRATPAPKPSTGLVWSPGAQRFVAVTQVPTDGGQRPRRKPFEVQWARFPAAWAAALRQTKSISAVHLAIAILFAEFRREHTGGEIVLSTAMSGMPNATRADATRELVRLGLIEVAQHGRQAPRVVKVNVGGGGLITVGREPNHGGP